LDPGEGGQQDVDLTGLDLLKRAGVQIRRLGQLFLGETVRPP